MFNNLNIEMPKRRQDKHSGREEEKKRPVKNKQNENETVRNCLTHKVKQKAIVETEEK